MLAPDFRTLAVLSLGALAVAPLAAAPASAAEPRCQMETATHRSCTLPLNKSLIIDLPRDARDVLVSNPEIADAVIRTSRRIYLTGIGVGSTNLFVFDTTGEAIVSLELAVERDISGVEETLRRLIPGSNITVELINDNVVLSGSVKTAADARRAQDLAAVFANGGALAQTREPDALAGGGVSIAMAGAAAEPPQSQVVNLLAIEGQDQVYLKVTVSEIQRNIAKQLGVDLQAGMDMGGLVSRIITDNPFTNAISNTVASATNGTVDAAGNLVGNGIMGTIRALEREGMVRMLAEPTLTAISGESANFLAGGEFPVPTGRDRDGNITIEYKPYGVGLTFTPVVLSEGRISIRVKTEVSELSQEDAFELGDIVLPSITVRRAETTLELPSGGSLVLGGLLQDTVRQNITGFPGLKRLPVLGALFRSRDFLRQETELVIIVTPYLVQPVPVTALARPDDGFAPASDSAGIFLGRINRMYSTQGAPSQDGGYQGRFGFIFD